MSTNYARVNGRPVVLVSIQQTTNSNAVAVVRNVQHLLKQTKLPAGYTITYSNDTTAPIQASLNSTYREILITAIVVALIVLLFLGKLNTAFSVILAVPIALSAAPVLYNLAGFTLNLVSMLAMIVAIGIVVDDSIVVAENVERYRVMGFSQKEAVLKGASEIFSAVVAATLSLLSVLIPVSFIGGIIGQFLRQFALGLAAAVAFSLLEAVLFLTVRLAYTPDSDRTLDWRDLARAPACSANRCGGASGVGKLWGIIVCRRPGHRGVWPRSISCSCRPASLPVRPRYPALPGTAPAELLPGPDHDPPWLDGSRPGVGAGGLRAGRWPAAGAQRVVLLVTVGVLVLIVVLVIPRITFSFAPQSDNGTITVNVSMHTGSTLAATNTRRGRWKQYLLQQPEVKTVQTVVGSVGIFTVGVNRPENTTMVVQLVPLSHGPGVYVLMPGTGQTCLPSFPLTIPPRPSAWRRGRAPGRKRHDHPEPAFLRPGPAPEAATRGILPVLQNNPFVTSVTSSLSNVTVERDFTPSESKMEGTGISPGAVASLLQTYASGTQAADVQIGGQSYPIMVQIDPTVPLRRTVAAEPARSIPPRSGPAAGGPAGQPRPAPVARQRAAVQPPVHRNALHQSRQGRPAGAQRSRTSSPTS